MEMEGEMKKKGIVIKKKIQRIKAADIKNLVEPV